MERKNKRKRINKTDIVGEVIVDVEAFVKNKSSQNAKKIITTSEHIEIEIYFDKHYLIRLQHGDQDGRRDGIASETVQALLVKAAKHLFYYSIRCKGFSFVNFEANIRPERIVLTEEIDNGLPLNIVVEYHYLGLNKYEVTLITALCTDQFRLSDGQYQLVLQSDETSILNQLQRGKVVSVSEYAP